MGKVDLSVTRSASDPDQTAQDRFELPRAHINELGYTAVELGRGDVPFAPLLLELMELMQDDALDAAQAVTHIGEPVFGAPAGHGSTKLVLEPVGERGGLFVFAERHDPPTQEV